MRRLIQPNGNFADLDKPLTWDQMKSKVCGDPTSLVEIVRIFRWPEGIDGPKEPHILLCDEEGATNWHPGYPLPVNEEATKYYHANCMKGTTWPIRGTAYICPFNDYE